MSQLLNSATDVLATKSNMLTVEMWSVLYRILYYSTDDKAVTKWMH